MNPDTVSNRFQEASQAATQTQGAHTIRDRRYQAMSECHAATIRFLEQLHQAWQPIIQDYNDNARAAGLRSEAASSINPGHFLGPQDSPGTNNGAPSITLQDIANGSHIMRVALLPIPQGQESLHQEEESPNPTLRPQHTGYHLPGTGFRISSSTLPPWTQQQLGRLTGQCVASLEAYLEQRGHA